MMVLSNVVPRPRYYEERAGVALNITGGFRVDNQAGPECGFVGPIAEQILRAKTPSRDATSVVLVLGKEAVPDHEEGYRILVLPSGVKIKARTCTGLLRGAATLAQLCQTRNCGELPQMVIEDRPRFDWRGLSFDVARSFYPPQEVKKVIDLLTYYKMNVLHLHLTDDQGWRIEVDGYPELTEISGKTSGEGGRSGYFTKEEFTDLVEYAATRGVTIIPEIDLPGHTNAATHAVGDLVPGGKATEAYSGAEVGFSRLWAHLDSTQDFVDSVLTSLTALSPADYVHVGGDEALELSQSEYKELVELVLDSLAETGKKPVGWQEIAAVDLPGGSLIQYWDTRQDPAPVLAAVDAGARVIMSPAPHAYFDMGYEDQTPYGGDWAGNIDLETAYTWEPSEQVEGLPESAIIGVEGAVWTEKIHDFSQLSYMLLPRLAALAELGWSAKEALSWEDFASRIASQKAWWEEEGYDYYPEPTVAWSESE